MVYPEVMVLLSDRGFPLRQWLGIRERRSPVLPAFRYPQYRLLWLSGLSTWIGRWMEMTVGTWLVLELTNSPVLVLGLLGTCRFALDDFGAVLRHGLRSRPSAHCPAGRANRLRYGRTDFTGVVCFRENGGLASVRVHLLAGLCYAFDFASRYSVATGIVKEDHIVSSISLLWVANGVTSAWWALYRR